MAESIRIRKIADMVKKGMITADIGTDHAFLPILLIQRGTCEKVYACDVAKGPLSAAETNIAKAGCSGSITTVLSDGLANVPEDTECIVIAGMGYQTARGILERSMDRLSSFDQIIVEVNRDTVSMRKWISEHGFTIENEIFVHDRGHDYITVDFSTQPHVPYTYEEIILGPVLMKTEDSDWMDYIRRRQEKLSKILSVSENPEMAKECAVLTAFIEEK